MNAQKLVVGISTVALMAGSVLANGQIQLSDATGFYDGTDGTGGAFRVSRLSGYVGERFGEQGLNSSTFHSFCIEVGELVSFGGIYYAEISTSAKAGGAGFADPSGSDSGVSDATQDFLSFTTAKIYSEFRNNGNFGGVGTFADGYNTSQESTDIQQAIWYSEGEVTWGSITANAQAIFTWASANHGGTLGNVRVLRLWDNYDPMTGVYSGNRQDLLTLIPLPTAGGLALAGLFGMGVSIRSRRTFA